MHIHLLRLSGESENMRKCVRCIASPLKSKRTKWHPHNLKFVQILEIYFCIPQVLIIFVNCHSLMQVLIIFVIL